MSNAYLYDIIKYHEYTASRLQTATIWRTALVPATNCNQAEQNLYVQLPETSVLVNPNPTTGMLAIEIPFEYTSLEFSIIDNVGRLVDQGKEKSSAIFNANIEGEQAGIYFLRLIIDENRAISKKIVLIK